MALEKSTFIGHIGVLPSGHLEIRQDTVITENGIELSRTFHRLVLTPGDDVSAQDPRVQQIAQVLWTPEVIAASKSHAG